MFEHSRITWVVVLVFHAPSLAYFVEDLRGWFSRATIEVDAFAVGLLACFFFSVDCRSICVTDRIQGKLTCIGVTWIERTPLISMRPWLSSGAVYKKGALIGLIGVWLLPVWFSDWP